MVGAIAYAAGNSFKDYYRVRITEGRDLTADQIKEMAQSYFRDKIT
jgi:hypothetical protein